MKKKVIKKGERIIVYAFAIIVDIIQIILDFFVVTEIINHIIDIVVGFIILAYGTIRGIIDGNKLLILGAYFIGEQIPFINALPFWTLDVKNLFSNIPSKEDELDAETERIPGITRSRTEYKPVNSTEGIRPPRLSNKNPIPMLK